MTGIVALWALLSAAQAQESDEGAEPTQAALEEVAPAEAVSDASYVIDEGDVLRVEVYGEEDLSGPVTVGQGGTIQFPLVGELAVAGMTTHEVSRELATRLGEKYLQKPQVTVRMDRYASKPVQVLGAVERPGVYYLRGTTTLLEMLALAGDVDNEHGAIKVIHLRRAGETIVVPLDPLVQKGEGDSTLQAGDVVYVPEGLVVYVSGHVEEPGEIAFSEKLTVTRALAKAGGPKQTARLKEAYILRDGEKIPIPLRAIMQGREADVELQPGDQLFIQESVL